MTSSSPMIHPIGIGAFLNTDRDGFQAHIKINLDDFAVSEIGLNGNTASISSSSWKFTLPTKELNSSIEEIVPEPIHEPAIDVQLIWQKAISTETEMVLEGVNLGTCLEEVILSISSNVNERRLLIHAILMKWPLLQCRTAPQLENSTIDRQLIVQQDSRVKVLVPEIMSHEDGVRLFTFLHCKQFNDSISLTAMEKDDRRIQHVKIGSLFKSSGITTKTNNGATVVMWKAKRKRKLMDDSIWYNGVLLKTGWEHFQAMTTLATVLGIETSKITIAGIKDKRAVTHQFISIKTAHPERLANFNELCTARKYGLQLGPCERVETPLQLGQLQGNRFRLCLRHVVGIDAVDTAFTHLKNVGFLNYFGPQRVGRPEFEIRTHHVGQSILSGEWETAYLQLFQLHHASTDGIAKAKGYFLQEGDVAKALAALPLSCRVERKLLQYHTLPRQTAVERVLGFDTKRFYYHAFQSYLFNVCLTYRIQTFGDQPMIGDFVLADKKDVSAQIINADTIGTYTMTDVVLPLLGSLSNIPAPLRDFVLELLQQCGFASLEIYQEACLKVKLRGTYRSIVVQPQEMTWTKDIENYIVQVDFTLPPGSFATMALYAAMHQLPKTGLKVSE